MTHSLLIFVHIPKAAGMTLHRIIARQYPKGSVFFVDGQRVRQDTEKFFALPEAERAKYHGIVGHFPFGLHEFLTMPVRYITILRDPVDRLVSHYYYAKGTASNRLSEWIKNENVDLERYINEGLPANGQTRMVCGFTKDQMTRHEDPATDILAIAKANLRDHFTVFGLAERFDDSMLRFQKALGWGNVYYRVINTTKDRPQKDAISGDVRRAIEKHSPLDFELYEYAARLYDEQAERYNITPADIEAYRRGNERFGRVEGAKMAVKQIAKKILGRG